VKFRITPHSGTATAKRPADALDLLWERLGTRREETRFAKVGSEIRATWGEGMPASMDRDERAEIGRREVLAILSDVCESAPELKLDWFAVGYFE
jgi:hypothetical protein